MGTEGKVERRVDWGIKEYKNEMRKIEKRLKMGTYSEVN